MSARSSASRARSTEKYSVPRSVRTLAAHAGGVDEAHRALRCLDHGVDASRVVPGRSWTTDRSSPTSRLNSVDLPTLGRPTRATRRHADRLAGRSPAGSPSPPADRHVVGARIRRRVGIRQAAAHHVVEEVAGAPPVEGD